MPVIQKTYDYKVYRNGVYLGLLPQPTNDFSYSQELYSNGASLTVEVPIKVDRSDEAPNYLGSEDGFILTAEDGTYLTTQRQEDVIGDDNDNILIRNGNALKVIEYSSYWPNGQRVFSGFIKRIKASFGNQTADEGVTLYAYSDGEDLKNYLIPGTSSNVLEQDNSTFSTNNGYFAYNNYSGHTQWMGQTFQTGAAITNISVIRLRIGAYAFSTPGNIDTTIALYQSPNDIAGGVAPIATTIISVSAPSTSPTEAFYDVAFSSPVTTTPLTTYTWVGYATATPSVGLIYFVTSEANSYANGNGYRFDGTTVPTSYSETTNAGGGASTTDFYFQTYYSILTTRRTFTATDPTAIVNAILPYYNSSGGLVTAGTLQNTGLSVNYPFVLATIQEGIDAAIKLSPSSWYWYVDVGTSQLTFRQVSTTADIKLTKGLHIDALELVMSTENIINNLYFTGGDIGSGINLFKNYTDTTSIKNNRTALDRQANNRVIDSSAADAIGTSFIAANKDQQYQTVVTVLDQQMDISSLKPGMTIGFNGFGNLVDRLIIQVVRIDYYPDYVNLTLGALPPRTDLALQQALNDINDLQTIDNPNIPS
jgi:hypothetical protein